MPKQISSPFPGGTWPFGRIAEAKLSEREDAHLLTTRTYSWDVTVEKWNARAVLARAIRTQERRGRKNGDYRAVVPLTQTEGY